MSLETALAETYEARIRELEHDRDAFRCEVGLLRERIQKAREILINAMNTYVEGDIQRALNALEEK